MTMVAYHNGEYKRFCHIYQDIPVNALKSVQIINTASVIVLYQHSAQVKIFFKN